MPEYTGKKLQSKGDAVDETKSPTSALSPHDVAPLLIHIGYHKTGSTWLQKGIFANGELGCTTETGEPRHRLVEHFVRPDPFGYDSAAVAERYKFNLEDARNCQLKLVLSHERMSGYPSSGGHDRAMIAQRLKATFPDARMLIVLREQKALTRSMYSQHITAGGFESLNRFLNTPEPALGRKPSFSLVFYEFDRLISHHQALFGKNRVLALPFEMLRSNPQEFADRISGPCNRPKARFAAIKSVNEKRPMMMRYVQRPLNALFYHDELSPGTLVHITLFHRRSARLTPFFRAISPIFLENSLNRRLCAAIDHHVGDYFAQSNSRTQQLTGLSLAALGEPV